MEKFILHTSNKHMEVHQVEATQTEYDMMKCILNNGEEIFIKKSNCYDTKQSAKEALDELHFINKFKYSRRDKKTKTWQCHYCGKTLKTKSQVTVDHIKPKSKGGKTTYSNLCISCSTCNKTKSSKHKNHYMKLMKRNDKIKMTNPNKFNGKVRNVAHKKHKGDAESIARMDSNTISPKLFKPSKYNTNMVDRVLEKYNSRRMK